MSKKKRKIDELERLNALRSIPDLDSDEIDPRIKDIILEPTPRYPKSFDYNSYLQGVASLFCMVLDEDTKCALKDCKRGDLTDGQLWFYNAKGWECMAKDKQKKKKQ